MYLVYNEAAAVRVGKKELYEEWFQTFGVDKNEVVEQLGASKYGQDFVKVSRPRGNWSRNPTNYVEVHKSVYLPVVLDKDLGDYL